MATSTATKTAAANQDAAVASAEDIEAQVARVREDIASLARSVQTYGSAKTGEYKARASKAGTDLATASQETIDNLYRELQGLEQQLEGKVRQHPLQSLGIAAGVGFLVAMLMRR